mmetsp:Transcript_9201/g.27712  ORF Transcript_9201/g.27712 Transcript_9201/m.27712 type:complete len:210 (-) Transcript_9201:309-938(-)
MKADGAMALYDPKSSAPMVPGYAETFRPIARAEFWMSSFASGSFTVAARSLFIVTVALQLCTEAMPLATSSILFSSNFLTSSSAKRMVPWICTLAGNTLTAVPPLIFVTEITAVSRGFMSRATIVCMEEIMLEVARMASELRCGYAAWPPMPSTVTSNSRSPASMKPARLRAIPGGVETSTCSPKTNFAPSTALSSTILLAPLPSSSAG